MTFNVFLLVLLAVGISGQKTGVSPKKYEPSFEYEYKVLGKLMQLQLRMRTLQKSLRDQAEFIKLLSTKTEDTSEALGSLQYITGSTYVRWGRTTCPGNGTELVYEGYAGGSYYTHYGGAAKPLCLPHDPDWDKYHERLDSYSGFVYGAEYNFQGRSDYMSFFPEIDQSKAIDYQDVPCAVCRSPRASVVMVPAKNRCHGGWSLEYTGYIMAGYYGHRAPSDYVCMDRAPEAVRGGAPSREYGYLFYLTEARCGSLKCPPYVNGRELTCAVCSK